MEILNCFKFLIQGHHYDIFILVEVNGNIFSLFYLLIQGSVTHSQGSIRGDTVPFIRSEVKRDIYCKTKWYLFKKLFSGQTCCIINELVK